VEEVFGIVMPEETLARIETLGDLYAKVMEIRESLPEETGVAEVQSIHTRIIASGRPVIEIPRNQGLFYRFAPDTVTALSRLFWKVGVSGAEQIPVDRPAIFTANHECLLDVVWIIGALPWVIREKTFAIGKSELLRNPLVAAILKRSNLIGVEREGDVVDALGAAVAVLRQGCNLVIFPEGTRTRDGRMGRFKSGIGRLMLETNANVVPVRIQGGFAIWPAGKLPRFFLGRSLSVSVRFGQPLTLQSLIEQAKISPYSSAADITGQIQEIIAAM
jgi:long-chain acyl-CoA synthetase